MEIHIRNSCQRTIHPLCYGIHNQNMDTHKAVDKEEDKVVDKAEDKAVDNIVGITLGNSNGHDDLFYRNPSIWSLT
jgi:hypothetical protein